MTTPENDNGSNDDPIVLGTPEGDGDFESDGKPEMGETSAGGQVGGVGDVRRDAGEESELMKVIDEVSTGKIQP